MTTNLLINSTKVGENIKKLRESSNLTQEELGDLIGYSERTIRRIESNGTNSLEVINAFATFFNISAVSILIN